MEKDDVRYMGEGEGKGSVIYLGHGIESLGLKGVLREAGMIGSEL